MAIQDVSRAAVETFPHVVIRTPAGDLPLITVMVAIAGDENPPDWGNAPGDPLSIYRDGGASERPYSCRGMTSFGGWQINLPAHYAMVAALSGIPVSDPCGQAAWLADYGNCARAAYAVWRSQGLGAWTTWNDGGYLRYLHQAQLAVNAALATSSFHLGVSRISSGISASAVPTATISVSNLGIGSGIDAVTGVTTDAQGAIVGRWTTSDSPLVPPGSAQPVSLRMLAAPGSQYAGQTLTATFTDNHGNHAQANFSIAAAGGAGTPPPPPSSTPPAPEPTSFPWGAVAGSGVAVAGVVALYLSAKRH